MQLLCLCELTVLCLPLCESPGCLIPPPRRALKAPRRRRRRRHCRHRRRFAKCLFPPRSCVLIIVPHARCRWRNALSGGAYARVQQPGANAFCSQSVLLAELFLLYTTHSAKQVEGSRLQGGGARIVKLFAKNGLAFIQASDHFSALNISRIVFRKPHPLVI